MSWATRWWPRCLWPADGSSIPCRPRPTAGGRWSALCGSRSAWTTSTGGCRPGRPIGAFTHGSWGLGLLSRVPFSNATVIDLGKLRRDAARRAVIHCDVEVSGVTIAVYGTHMSHITHGSHAQYRRLSRQLPPPSSAAVLAGDMNLWGPPVSSYFRGWRRALRARTWPAHRPHSQLDHVLVTPAVRVLDAYVGDFAGSDHRPVVVTVGAGLRRSREPVRPSAGPPISVHRMPRPAGRLRPGHLHRSRTRPDRSTGRGSGPAVIVMSEMPGITPNVAGFARLVAEAGFTAVMPHLFGDDGRAPTAGYTMSSLARACITREFTLLAKARPVRSSPGCGPWPGTSTIAAAAPVSERWACASPGGSLWP